MEVNVGVRQWLGPQLEVGGQIGHLNISDHEKKQLGWFTAGSMQPSCFLLAVKSALTKSTAIRLC